MLCRWSYVEHQQNANLPLLETGMPDQAYITYWKIAAIGLEVSRVRSYSRHWSIPAWNSVPCCCLFLLTSTGVIFYKRILFPLIIARIEMCYQSSWTAGLFLWSSQTNSARWSKISAYCMWQSCATVVVPVCNSWCAHYKYSCLLHALESVTSAWPACMLCL